MITIRQIAKIAGVSPATVSKALNNQKDISDETKDYIAKIARDNGYVKKNFPQGSHSDFSGMHLGILFSDLKSDYYTRMLKEIVENIQRNNGIVFTIDTEFSEEFTRKACRYLDRTGIVDGIICMTQIYQRDILESIKVPLVSFSVLPSMETRAYDYIFINERTGFDEAASRLMELGHRKFAYLGEKKTFKRREYFNEVLDSRGIPKEDRVVLETDLRFEDAGYVLMKQLLERKELPSAIFAAYDRIAAGAVSAIHEAGFTVPGDFSVFGVDNCGQMTDDHKQMSSIDCKLTDQVTIALALLSKRINDRSAAIQNVSLLSDFVERDTIGPAPAWKNRPDE